MGLQLGKEGVHGLGRLLTAGRGVDGVRYPGPQFDDSVEMLADSPSIGLADVVQDAPDQPVGGLPCLGVIEVEGGEQVSVDRTHRWSVREGCDAAAGQQ
ncbi:hypothetical protein [Nocardia xishanensis]